jgi:uncharacterized membrane protein
MSQPARDGAGRIVGAVALTALYPLLVWVGLMRWSARTVAFALGGVILVRALAVREGRALALAGGILLLAAALLSGTALPLKLYPVLVNATMLALFASSLRAPPTIIERAARLRGADPGPAASAYMRRLTVVWCGFFMLNGAIAFVTARWASDAVWTLYNGMVSYLLIGILLGGELLVRKRVVQRAHDG